jgi:8-oxo-dGTP pyrophosphatase MutT (NUDIX family)
MSSRITEKVIAYITSADRLLVFAHPYHPEAGIQVPAGTVEPGEPIEAAVLREAREETGLEELEIRAYLGAQVHDLAAYGRSGLLRRHFFHLVFHGEAPSRWTHFEMHPSEGAPDPIEFELYWVQLPSEVPNLAGQQDELLHLVRLRTD